EHDAADAGCLRLGRDGLADLGRLRDAVAFRLHLERRRRGQRAAGAVVDELRVEVVEAAEHRQARALGRAGHVHAHALVALQPVDLAVLSPDHAVAFAPFPALPGLRRTFSPAYLTPLPL